MDKYEHIIELGRDLPQIDARYKDEEHRIRGCQRQVWLHAEPEGDSLQALQARRSEQQSGAVDVDEVELAESLELPGADLSAEELTVRVVPKQDDEFTCMSCFLVHHRSQLAEMRGDQPICSECAA